MISLWDKIASSECIRKLKKRNYQTESIMLLNSSGVVAPKHHGDSCDNTEAKTKS